MWVPAPQLVARCMLVLFLLLQHLCPACCCVVFWFDCFTMHICMKITFLTAVDHRYCPQQTHKGHDIRHQWLTNKLIFLPSLYLFEYCNFSHYSAIELNIWWVSFRKLFNNWLLYEFVIWDLRPLHRDS